MQLYINICLIILCDNEKIMKVYIDSAK